MGKRGPAPKPEEIKKLQGTSRPDRKPAIMPAYPTGAEAPGQMDPMAVAEWERLAPEVERLGLLTVADEAMFAAYCQAYSDWRRVTQKLNAMGPDNWVIETEVTMKPHPLLKIREAAWNALRRAAAQFGFDPASRTRIDLAPKDAREEAVDPDERFLGLVK